MPTLSEMEEWLEEQIPQNLQDLPSKLHETLSIYYESLYHELTRYGSPLPSISLPDLSCLGLPTLSQIEQTLPFTTPNPPPPPPPAPPVGLIQRTSNHIANHSGKYLATSLTLGLGLTVWYSYAGPSIGRNGKGKGRKHYQAGPSYWFDWRGLNRKRDARVERGLRREAVVVLGADTPLGRSLALSLSTSSNLIVLCTISSPSSLNSFESLIPPSSRGYVKALLLDARDPVSSIPSFIRDVKAALGLRWPSTVAGDPYARKGEEISLTGVVNCLSYLPEINSSFSTSTNEDQLLQLDPTNMTQLLDSFVSTPLCVISSLIPFLKTPTSSYMKSLNSNIYVGNNRMEFELSPSSTVISILPSLTLGVSLPSKLRESVVAKAVQSGMETLKRENQVVELNQLHQDGGDEGDDLNFGRRDVRFTTLTLSAGNAFSFGFSGSQSHQNETSNVSNSTSSINSDSSPSSSRPGMSQSGSSSSSTLSTWASRDHHTQLVVEKVSSLLLKRSCYKLPALTNLHLGFQSSLINGRLPTPSKPPRNKQVFTQAQITQTSHASNNTRTRRTLSKLNSQLATLKAYWYSIYGSIRNSVLHYLTSFSHFLIQDLSPDVLDSIISLNLRRSQRQIRKQREKQLRDLKKKSRGGADPSPSQYHKKPTARQSNLTTPASTSGLGSSPLHTAPPSSSTDSNPTSSIPNSTRSFNSSSTSSEAEISGPGSSGSENEDGYDINSLPDSNNGSQMTNSVEFDQQRNSESDDVTLHPRERENLSRSQQLESGNEGGVSSQEGSVMGESWVRLNGNENEE